MTPCVEEIAMVKNPMKIKHRLELEYYRLSGDKQTPLPRTRKTASFPQVPAGAGLRVGDGFSKWIRL